MIYEYIPIHDILYILCFMNKLFCDVLIFGAGIIGASLASRLMQSGIKVIIVDHKYPNIIKNNTTPPIRVAAINFTSVNFLKKINVWNNISSHFYTSYHKLEVWEWLSSKVTFHSMSLGLSEMGRIIENNRLQLALWENFLNCNAITLCCPSVLSSIHYNGLFWKCILDNNTIIISPLLIGADGMNSQIRKQLRIGISGWEYHQYCMLLTIKVDKDTRGTIWQIFRPNGPIGFLPLHDHWGILMWYDTPDQIHKLQKLPAPVLEKKIENNFQKKIGHVKLYNVIVAPLINQYSYSYISPLGGALVGDAAHTLHPLAGQGINLGLRDVISLSDLLINSRAFDEHSSILEVLISYQNNRQNDIFFMQTSINYLYIIFHNKSLPLKIIRNIAFMTIERSSCLKQQILKYALGI